ncbi:MAG: phosphoserine phosphatase SerB [Microbacteriaceae bacterium]|nr:phosphoserine phosphatase SerB [Microbacteriaceae bacterium]
MPYSERVSRNNKPFLVVMDVDSTLINEEVIELLADLAGMRTEIASITEKAMQGEIEFTESLKMRVSLLKGLAPECHSRVLSQISLTQGAEKLVNAVKNAGGYLGLVSGGFIEVIKPLIKGLDIDFCAANQLEISEGFLTGKTTGEVIDRAGKAKALKNWANQLKIPISQTIAIGDGANDIEMFAAAGLSIAFNAKPLARKAAHLVIDNRDLSQIISVLGI